MRQRERQRQKEREMSHDAACGATVNNELTIIDCEIRTVTHTGVQKTGADV